MASLVQVHKDGLLALVGNILDEVLLEFTWYAVEDEDHVACSGLPQALDELVVEAINSYEEYALLDHVQNYGSVQRSVRIEKVQFFFEKHKVRL